MDPTGSGSAHRYKVNSTGRMCCRVNETVSGDWTALMWAAWYGELAVVKMLLQVPGIQVDNACADSTYSTCC